jgi:hypothetical protein
MSEERQIQLKPIGSLQNGPALGALEVVPSDTADLSVVSRGLYVGEAGDIKMTMADDTVVTRKNVPVGEWPWRVKRIWATGTTAAYMIADY